MNFYCDFPNCKKKFLNAFFCKKCREKFCSDDCKINHSIKTHKLISTTSIKSNLTRNSLPKSSFMKLGLYLREITYDSLYDFKNFEFVKKFGNKNHVLGIGAFGDVLLARNIINDNLYAIKQMKKIKIIENGTKFDVIKREIDIHIRLIHENIVRMYSYYEDKEAFYIVNFNLILGYGLYEGWNNI